MGRALRRAQLTQPPVLFFQQRETAHLAPGERIGGAEAAVAVNPLLLVAMGGSLTWLAEVESRRGSGRAAPLTGRFLGRRWAGLIADQRKELSALFAVNWTTGMIFWDDFLL